MAILTSDYVLEGSLARLAEGDELHLCSAQPASYAQATTAGAVSLGSVPLTVGLGNGDYTVADGDTDGRKVTVAAQSVPVTTDGTANHVAIVDTGNSRLLHVTTTTSRPVLNGDTYDAAAFDALENRDAA